MNKTRMRANGVVFKYSSRLFVDGWITVACPEPFHSGGLSAFKNDSTTTCVDWLR